MKKLTALFVVAAVCLASVPQAEAGPLRKAARGVGCALRFVKNHIPLVRRIGR